MSLPEGTEFWWSVKGYTPKEKNKRRQYKSIYRIIVGGHIVEQNSNARQQTKQLKNRVILKRIWNNPERKWKDDSAWEEANIYENKKE